MKFPFPTGGQGQPHMMYEPKVERANSVVCATLLYILSCSIHAYSQESFLAPHAHRYTLWPTEIRSAPARAAAIIAALHPNTKVTVLAPQGEWCEVSFPPEDSRQKRPNSGYVKPSSLHEAPLVRAPSIPVVNGAGSTPAHVREDMLDQGLELAAQSRYGEAVALLREAVAATQAELGSAHRDVATCLATWAQAYQMGQQYAVAMELYQRSLDIYKSLEGTNTYALAAVMNNIAVCQVHMGEYQQAQLLFDQSLSLVTNAVGIQSWAPTQMLRNIADLCRKTGQQEKASALEKRVEENLRHMASLRRRRVAGDTSSGRRSGISFSGRLIRDRHILEPELRRIEGVIRRQLGSVHEYTPPEWE